MLALTLVSAHLGHWYIELPIYLAPVIVVGAWVKFGDRRQQRRAQDEAPGATGPEPPASQRESSG